MKENVTKRKSNTMAKAKKAKMALIVRTLIILAVCGVAAFVGLALRLYDIQVANSGYYESRALQSQLRQTTLMASRGAIFDTHGNILAMSSPAENIFISPLEIAMNEQSVDLIATGLSEILGVSRDMVLERARRTSSQYERIKMKVLESEAGMVREFIAEHSLKGIHFEQTSKRHYPNNKLASQIIGFVGTDDIGLDGLERRYEGILSGTDGRTVTLRSGRGTDLLFAGYEDHFSALDGYDITLTIDSSIQYYMERHLEQAIIDYDVINGATAIAMNPKSGAVLAIANYPNYDPSDFLALGDRDLERLSLIEDEQERAEAFHASQLNQWRNRALTDTYEPGSVFKIMTLAMAIEENVVSMDSQFYCHGMMHIPGRLDSDGEPVPLRCWRRWGHGEQTINEAFQNSCNIASVEQGLGVGSRAFYRYIGAFGLFDRTGLDNSIESKGLWWNERIFTDRNNQSQLASASFGQTFKITPIQMITAAAATINGGYLMEPYIVRQITDSNGNIIETKEPTMLRQVISSNTSACVRSVLEGVVESGTGKNAKIRGYRVGGKTGTSENVEQITMQGEGAEKDYIVSFIGFAPADDPEIIILLLLDTPSNETGIYISGGSMSAPVVGNMLADILPLSLGIRPQYTEEDLQDINVIIPRVMGRSLADAKAQLEGQGYEYMIVGDGGTVRGQLPMPNAHVTSGTMITLYTEQDIPRDSVTIPSLAGMTYSEAEETLKREGIYIRTTGASRSDPRVVVSVQSMPPNSIATYGSVVEVTLIDREIIELRN